MWYQHKRRVYYKETDQMGVVHHGNYLSWFEVSRLEWMRHFDLSYQRLEEEGLYLPVIETHLQFKRSAYFDDCIAVFTRLIEVSPTRLSFAYEVRRLDEKTYLVEGLEAAQKRLIGERLVVGETHHIWATLGSEKSGPNQSEPNREGVTGVGVRRRTEWQLVRLNRRAPELLEQFKALVSQT